jgi:hydroxyacylglutathione hydrolase
MITIKKFTVNPFQENTYLLSDESCEAVFVDAGFHFSYERKEVVGYLKRNELKPVMLVNTHCHFDHVMGVDFIRQNFGIPFLCHEEDAFWLDLVSDQSQSFGISMKNVAMADGFISEQDVIQFGHSSLRIIHVPGHSPGHVTFYSDQDLILFAGDSLFLRSIGRSDLPGGNFKQLIHHIQSKLFVLPPETKVWCGHGEETTIGYEIANNPFFISVRSD